MCRTLVEVIESIFGCYSLLSVDSQTTRAILSAQNASRANIDAVAAAIWLCAASPLSANTVMLALTGQRLTRPSVVSKCLINLNISCKMMGDSSWCSFSGFLSYY